MQVSPILGPAQISGSEGVQSEPEQNNIFDFQDGTSVCLGVVGED